MQTLAKAMTAAALALSMVAAPVSAETPIADGTVATVDALGATPQYPTLTRRHVVLVNAQRFVVAQEPLPVAKIAEAPPEPPTKAVNRPNAPYAGAIWVQPHWIYGPNGFSWVAGRYAAPKAGHVFVPPRWASLEGQYFYFSGFYVPYGVYVRSYFNRYYYSGLPPKASRPNHGPYWPIGAPTRANSSLTGASPRDPYWPIGVRR